MKARELLFAEKARYQARSPALPLEAEKLTFAQWPACWLEKLAQPSVKPSTLENYRQVLKKHLLSTFGRMELQAITKESINGFLSELQPKLAPSTVRAVCRILKSILVKAQGRGLCGNPFVENHVSGKSRRPRILTVDEQRKAERLASGEMRLVVLIGLYMGLRVGEICGLRREDFDWEGRMLTVQRSVQRLRQANGKTRLVIGTPKSDSGIRELPIPEPIFLLLQAAFQKNTGAGFVFRGRNGRPMEPRTAQVRLVTPNSGNYVAAVDVTGKPIPPVKTDANGNYLFEKLGPGKYDQQKTLAP